jgi:DNA-directed RNA polymerase alpha subunit
MLDEHIKHIRMEVLRRGQASQVRLQNVHHSVVNGIRRAVIADLPSMAIEYVLIRENSSVLPDEMISHRLGLVPLMADPRAYEYIDAREEARDLDGVYDKMSSTNAIFLKLSVENTSEDVATVHSEDMRLVDKEGFESDHVRGAPASSVVREGIPLAKLAPGQALDMKMVAIKGRGREHAKWNHASLCTYRLSADISIPDNSFTEEECAKIRKYFRGDGVRVEDGRVAIDPDRVIVNQDLFASEFRDRIAVKKRESSFLFQIETLGEDGVSLLGDGIRELIGRIDALADSVPAPAPETEALVK